MDKVNTTFFKKLKKFSIYDIITYLPEKFMLNVIRDIKYSKTITVVRHYEAQTYNKAPHKIILQIKADKSINVVSFSPDNALLAYGCIKNTYVHKVNYNKLNLFSKVELKLAGHKDVVCTLETWMLRSPADQDHPPPLLE